MLTWWLANGRWAAQIRWADGSSPVRAGYSRATSAQRAAISSLSAAAERRREHRPAPPRTLSTEERLQYVEVQIAAMLWQPGAHRGANYIQRLTELHRQIEALRQRDMTGRYGDAVYSTRRENPRQRKPRRCPSENPRTVQRWLAMPAAAASGPAIQQFFREADQRFGLLSFRDLMELLDIQEAFIAKRWPEKTLAELLDMVDAALDNKGPRWQRREVDF